MTHVQRLSGATGARWEDFSPARMLNASVGGATSPAVWETLQQLQEGVLNVSDPDLAQ